MKLQQGFFLYILKKKKKILKINIYIYIYINNIFCFIIYLLFSIDFSMDEKIQQMIRTEFLDCTILCIAHRLRTVIDYDKILVIGKREINN
jgi:hypothetical protein